MDKQTVKVLSSLLRQHEAYLLKADKGKETVASIKAIVAHYANPRKSTYRKIYRTTTKEIIQ